MSDEYDPIPETVAEALERWDSGRTVFAAEMGGLGPGYEQCIQILAFELMREWHKLEWPPIGEDMPEAFYARLVQIADPVVGRLNHLGFSGAQVAVAKNIAAVMCRRGYRTGLRMLPPDRLIQVAKNFPGTPEVKA